MIFKNKIWFLFFVHRTLMKCYQFIFIYISRNGQSDKVSLPVKNGLEQVAIQSSKKQLAEAMAQLEIDYARYHENPTLHPMYGKEWQIFYLRRLSDLLAGKNKIKSIYGHFVGLQLF